MFQAKDQSFIKKEIDDDEDDLFSVGSTNSSKKLAALFGNETSSKNSTLKYVAPKQPRKEEDKSVGPSVPPEKSKTCDVSSEVLFATAGKLFSYRTNHSQNATTTSEGLVMCCIIRKLKENCLLLVYKAKSNIISQATINLHFNIKVQKNNYVTFSDDSNAQWSIHIDGVKYQEFLTQIGICKAHLAFEHPSPPSVVTQDLSIGEGEESLHKGDSPVVSYCSWQVENYRRGKQIDDVREGFKLTINSDGSWEAGLIDRRRNQHCLIFVPNVQVNKEDKSVVIAYEVTIEALKALSTENAISGLPEIGLSQDNETTKKASLISRMAKVGQPLLPPTPKHMPKFASAPTDSESEEDPQHRPHGAKPWSNKHSSTSSSLEEINMSAKHTKSNSIPFDNSQFQGYVRGVGPFHPPSYGPQGQGAMIAYQPFPMLQKQQQQQQQQQQESISKNSESLLSLLFSESRSQNTELRVALAQLTQKIDLVFAKVNTLDTNSATSAKPTFPSTQLNHNPRDFLNEVTTLVDQVETYKHRSSDFEKKLEELTKDYTQILKKNQSLLEEKAELISLKGENLEKKHQSEKHLQELVLVQEEKTRVQKELEAARVSGTQLETKIERMKSQYADLQREQETNQQRWERINEERVASLANMNEEIERSHKRIEELSQKDEKWKEVNSEHEEQAMIMREERKFLEGTLTQLKNGNGRLDSELKLKEERILQLENVVKDMEQDKLSAAVRESSLKESLKESSLKESSLKESSLKESSLKEPSLKESSLKDSSQKEPSLKESSLKEPSLKEPSLKESSLKESSGVKDDEKLDPETIGKEIMNLAYKRLKKVFRSSETYDKSTILENVIAAFRDTILNYTVKETPSGISPSRVAPSEYARMDSTDEGQERKGSLISNTESTSTSEVSSVLPDPVGTYVPLGPSNLVPSASVFDSMSEPAGEDSMSSFVTVSSSTVENLDSSLGGDELCNEEVTPPAAGGSILQSNENVLQEDVNNLPSVQDGIQPSVEDGIQLSAEDDQLLPSGDGEATPTGGEILLSVENREGTRVSPYFVDKDSVSSEDGASSSAGIQSIIHETATNPISDMSEAKTLEEPSHNARKSPDTDEEAWRPAPPPPPLFSDSEDDDDWLS